MSFLTLISVGRSQMNTELVRDRAISIVRPLTCCDNDSIHESNVVAMRAAATKATRVPMRAKV